MRKLLFLLFFLVFLFVLLASSAHADSVKALIALQRCDALDAGDARRTTIAEHYDWANISAATDCDAVKADSFDDHNTVVQDLKGENPNIRITWHLDGRYTRDGQWPFDEIDGDADKANLFEWSEDASPVVPYLLSNTNAKLMQTPHNNWSDRMVTWLTQLRAAEGTHKTDGLMVDNGGHTIGLALHYCSPDDIPAVTPFCFNNFGCTADGAPYGCCDDDKDGHCEPAHWGGGQTNTELKLRYHREQMQEHLERIKTTAGSLLVYANVGDKFNWTATATCDPAVQNGDWHWCVPSLNGYAFENWIIDTADTLDTTVVSVDMDHLEDMIRATYTLSQEAVAIPKYATISNWQRKYALAAFLLSQHPTLSYYYIMTQSNGSQYASYDYYPEYDLNIGTPVYSPNTLSDLEVGVDTDVYARIYTHGRVVMNLSDSTKTYTTSQPYYKLEPKDGGIIGADGSITGCWTTTLLAAGDQSIPSGDALILATEEPENVCHAACLRNDGTAGSKVQVIDCEDASKCINLAVYDTETFSAGDKILICPNGGAFQTIVDFNDDSVTYGGVYSAVYGWPVFNEGIIISCSGSTFKGVEANTGVAESATKSFEGGRFAVCSGSSTIWQAAEETPVTDWSKSATGKFALGIGSVGGAVGNVTPQAYWRNVTDSGDFAAVGATGQVKYVDPGDCLTDESNVIFGEQGVTSSKEYVTCVTCEQEDSHQATSATNLADDKWAELQVGVSFADAHPGDEYQFALYENDTLVGISSATVTVAQTGCTSGTDCGITFWIGFDGNLSGELDGVHDYSADADYSAPSLQDDAAINTDASDRGYGLDLVDSGSDGIDLLKEQTSNPPNLEGIYNGGNVLFFVKFRVVSYTQNSRLMYVSENDGTDYSFITLASDDEIQFGWKSNGASTIYATSTDWNFALNTWYVMFASVNDSGDELKTYLYNYATGTQVGSPVTQATSLTTWDGNGPYKLHIGNPQAVALDAHIAVFGMSSDISSGNITKILDYIRLTSDDYPG